MNSETEEDAHVSKINGDYLIFLLLRRKLELRETRHEKQGGKDPIYERSVYVAPKDSIPI